MDWNGDGNHDWRDDAFFNNVIDSNNTSGSGSSSTGSGWGVAIIILLIISFFF